MKNKCMDESIKKWRYCAPENPNMTEKGKPQLRK